MEVLWTGTHAIMSRDPKLTCKTSVWMFPIYGMASLLSPISHRLKGKNILLRGSIYTLCIFATEYTTGTLLKKFGVCPWDYGHSRASINGIINLAYTPLWFCAGLFFERLLKQEQGYEAWCSCRTDS